MRPLLFAALAVACLAAGLSLPNSAAGATPVKVAIIVGPVGSLTPTYLALADAAAATAERHGATVARAYSPNATPANVLAAVKDANVVVYFGHGYGHPSPYGGLNTAKQNGWGLQGPRARGTHDDGLDGGLAYYGEDWIVANARPAPGFVMIYSNTCYAPGASEGGFAPATPQTAAERVAFYSRKVFTMGGSAYFATDFDRGAADLLDRMLGNPRSRYGTIFASDARYIPSAMTSQAHWFSAGQQIWLHRSKYTDGPPNYWYAFAGNPDATPIASWDPTAPTVALERPTASAGDVDPRVGLKLRFSEEVGGVSADTIRLLGPDGRPVAAEVVHNRATGAVRLEPATDLDFGTRYTVSVETGIGDAAGNRLKPVEWTFVTRLDADPWPQPVTVTLAAGAHRLVRLGADGTVSDEKVVEIDSERRVQAGSRARLPEGAGSWYEIQTTSLAGWWVAESARAYAAGTTEEVATAPTEVTLPIPAQAGVVESDAAPTATVTVNGRRVVDGRTFVHVSNGVPGIGGGWHEVPGGTVADDVDEQRILDRRSRASEADLRLASGPHVAFRFDDRGRVVERRTIAGGEGALVTAETLTVGAGRFHLVARGDLAGWAVAEGPGVEARVPEDRDPT